MLASERRPDERNQPEVGYAWSGESVAGEGNLCGKRIQLLLGYDLRVDVRSRLRVEYDLVTKNRNLVFPSQGIKTEGHPLVSCVVSVLTEDNQCPPGHWGQ